MGGCVPFLDEEALAPLYVPFLVIHFAGLRELLHTLMDNSRTITPTTSTTTTTRASSSVDIQPSGQVAVRVGEPLKIMCRVGLPVQYCRIEIPSMKSMFLQPNQNANDGIEYYGDGLQTGQCGVYIQRVKEEFDGKFLCAITTNGSRTEVDNTVKIVVAKPPKALQLMLSPGRLSGRNVYKNGEKLEISCSSLGGRPAANVSLFLDDQPLEREFGSNVYDSNGNENTLAAKNVSYTIKSSDNDAPQPQPPVELFGFVIGREGTINLTVKAHPRPRFIWYINGDKINEGSPDMSNRLQSSSAVEVAKGEWRLELKIDSVQKSDTEKEYKLEARNDEGAEEYRILLSTSAEPEGVDLDAGYIIGIVVGILVIIVLSFLIIFARATGRWCFAARRRGDEEAAGNAGAGSEAHITPGDDEDDEHNNQHIIDEKIPHGGQENPIHASTESDTESAGRYSRTEVDSGSGRPRRPKIMLTQLFKRNKDKVSGSDTDTMKTVIPESNGEKVNPEGGLVYAELDLTPREPNPTPRRVSEDKTEYAEILYTKTDGTEEPVVKN
ncbi:Similar to Fas3: Fasciclin-3 (Drosophila melanogaster) [Cotesia congregata]|uniref:Similar to Fas3: Fasciclin-3 (Drosophila melanogaster) n=1 Tax=Cotesia congregata TaxID=51543 RepID=A0A8J2MRG1_COTCN|nr:Similar to Fas3: Fasciclin-3 (Drosophila melanogaster) [Cotesia congregata]